MGFSKNLRHRFFPLEKPEPENSYEVFQRWNKDHVSVDEETFCREVEKNWPETICYRFSKNDYYNWGDYLTRLRGGQIIRVFTNDCEVGLLGKLLTRYYRLGTIGNEGYPDYKTYIRR